MKFKNFFVVALCLAVVANMARANTGVVPFGEAAIWHQLQQQMIPVGQAQPSPRAGGNVAPGRAGGAAVQPQRAVANRAATPQAMQGAQVGQAAAQRAVAARSAAQAVPQAMGAGTAATAAVAPGRAQPQQQIQQQRAVTARSAVPAGRTVNAPGTDRGVVARNAATGRTVAARSATAAPGSVARISMGPTNIMRPPQRGDNQALAARLQTGQWGNLIDPVTGLLSGDAIAQCMEAYYACMDEICTARNPGQRRCACAARVVAFNTITENLHHAREDLLRVSGELSLIIAARGRPITAAFTLTEAEQTLACVSFRDAQRTGQLRNWCENNRMLAVDNAGLPIDCANVTPTAPSFCQTTLGDGWQNLLDGSDSTILSALQSMATSVTSMDNLTQNFGNDALAESFRNLNNMFSQIGMAAGQNMQQAAEDRLAQTWGYDLFTLAHNNVCARVLDSCFNGIFEVAAVRHQPSNLNSNITVSNQNANVETTLHRWQHGQRGAGASPDFFGYANNVDPFSALRQPISDARRAIIMRYLLDANADCDLYQEQLRQLAQNFELQRIAATNLLQTSRLEFQREAEQERVTRFNAGRNNLHACISELTTCYNDMERRNPGWGVTQIRNTCRLQVNAPACFREMICAPAIGGVQQAIDVSDDASCNPFNGECRNITTIFEILGDPNPISTDPSQPTTSGDSRDFREQCLLDNGAVAVRDWELPAQTP
ncbi:MAG: hypothetical protein FWC83_00425 [Alphaproteobacteria bacterium]|nr:hypothetical protein [Alphaproteobacteria bacterium]